VFKTLRGTNSYSAKQKLFYLAISYLARGFFNIFTMLRVVFGCMLPLSGAIEVGFLSPYHNTKQAPMIWDARSRSAMVHIIVPWQQLQRMS
jgi:hypothetical protein